MPAPVLNGWLIIDKPLGLGSTTAVSWVKRALREGGHGKVKVGHGGTLDPLATGVLPIALGEATKLAGRMLDASKTYDFTIGFGTQTDTLDGEGVVVATSDVRPTLNEVAAILAQFTGPIEQMPPAYSALKVDGKRAYALARAGKEVVLKTRAITVHALGIGHMSDSGVTLTANVSKGTYIRSLARDIAVALGTVGHVTMLRRTTAGPFTLENAIKLDNLDVIARDNTLEDVILPLTAGLDDIPALPVTPAQAAALRQGRVLTGIPTNDGPYLANDGATPVALVEVIFGEIRVVRGFNIQPDVAKEDI
ncbi:tRNA pseudouridine(55) synthase TruB [Sphingomonas sp.]|uniref:tRNA pseudouridine(55) synthase TruB n=1 Tax=Sphingomonas sp. TaxID=28214 RepID=UPI0025E34DD9|nr:tRNA pseudouridine(55) synthase TruB [Sphingomonas sp.]